MTQILTPQIIQVDGRTVIRWLPKLCLFPDKYQVTRSCQCMYIAKCCTQSNISRTVLLNGQTYFWTNINYICEGLHTHVTLFDGTILHYIICLKSPATMLIRLYLISKSLYSLPEQKAIWFLGDEYLLELMHEIDRNPGCYPTLSDMSPHSSRVSSGKHLHDIPIDFVRLLREKHYLPSHSGCTCGGC